MMKAKKKEIQDLIKKGAFKIIMKKEMPSDSNSLPGRFALAIKSAADGKVKRKARYAIGGHRGKLKEFMAHST